MNWQSRFQSNPQFAQAVRLATGRSSWVLKATGLVAVVVFLLPLFALLVLVFAALLVIAIAWVLFSSIDRVIQRFTGGASPHHRTAPTDDGRENVRIINRS